MIQDIAVQITGYQTASATTVGAVVEPQSTTTVEISRSAQEAAVSTQQVSANIGGVSAAADAAGRAATAVVSATEWMTGPNECSGSPPAA